MSDPYILRDSNGDPLGKHEKNPLLKLISFLYPNEPFQIHEIEENVVRKYFREKREREKQ